MLLNNVFKILKIIILTLCLVTTSASLADVSFFLSKKKTAQKWAAFPYYFRSNLQGHVASARVFVFPRTDQGFYWSLSSKWKISQGHKLSFDTRMIHSFNHSMKFSIDGQWGSFSDYFYSASSKNYLSDGKSHKVEPYDAIHIPVQKIYIKSLVLFSPYPDFWIGDVLEVRSRTEQHLDCFIKNDTKVFLKEACPSYAKAELAGAAGLHWKYDTRDSIFNPKKGFLQQGELKLGYDFNQPDSWFLSLDTNARWIFSLFKKEKWVIHAAAGLASIPSGAKHLPYAYQFKLGGAERLRGYHQARFHSNKYYLIQAEVSWPLKSWLESIAFVDVGGVQLDKSPYKSLGLGLRVGIPPTYEQRIRLEWAWGQDQKNFVVTFAYPY